MRTLILPDPSLAEVKPALTQRLKELSESINADNFAKHIDPLMWQVLVEGFDGTGAHEGTVWLLDSEGQYLTPALNSGPHSARIVGSFKQPLNSGLICMVFANEQPFAENEIQKNAQQSKLLDRMLGVQTFALIAVPLYLMQECRGVVSCVQLMSSASGEAPAGFTGKHLEGLLRTTSLLTRLLEYRFITQTLGLQSD